MKNNCGCLRNLLTFPKNVTKLDFIKDWIDWAEPLIKEIDTKVSNLETWKEGADADIADIQGQLGTFALKGHTHDSILDADTDSSVSISEGVLNIALHDPNTGGDIDITADSISNLQRAISDPDTEPTEDSNALITSGAVYAALQEMAAAIHEMAAAIREIAGRVNALTTQV